MPPYASRQVRGPATESSHRLLPGLLSALRCPCYSRLFLLFLPFSHRFLFSPGHGIISLKAHGGEGTTKEERLPYEADCIRPSRVLEPLAPRILSRSLSLSLALNHPRRSFSLTPGGVAAHAPGVSFLSVLRLCAPFSPRISFSRPPASSFLSLPLTRAIYFVFVPPVRVPFCSLARSLVRSAFALVRSPHRRVQTPRTDTLCRASVRSLARLPAIIVVFFVRTSAHSYPLARVLSQDES